MTTCTMHKYTVSQTNMQSFVITEKYEPILTILPLFAFCNNVRKKMIYDSTPSLTSRASQCPPSADKGFQQMVICSQNCIKLLNVMLATHHKYTRASISTTCELIKIDYYICIKQPKV